MTDPTLSLTSSPDTGDSVSPSRPLEAMWPTPSVFGNQEKYPNTTFLAEDGSVMAYHNKDCLVRYGATLADAVSALSASPKSTPTPAPSSRTDSPMSRTSAPFSQSPEIQSLRRAVSYRLSLLVASLASRTATPASGGASPTSATSGKIAGESFGTFDPALPSSRTLGDSSPPLPLPRMVSLSGDFFSIAFCQTWPRFGTLANGTLYRQPTLAHRTDGIASGSSALTNSDWPTPRTSDQSDASQVRVQEMEDGTGLTTYNLREAVLVPRAVSQDWPTAAARDYKGARSEEAIAATGRNPMTNSLEDAIQAVERSGPPRAASGLPVPASDSTGGSRAESWATPRTKDADGWRMNMARLAAGKPEDTLTGQVTPKGSSGKLNPSWVETLMGLPMGWTQLPQKFVKPKRGTP